jgi:CTP:molybdopterin cytidylyltransferase MocA
LNGFTALVLAGSRPGDDPVATYAGAPHKGLIRLQGMTLLERVLRALEEAGARKILVSTGSEEVAAALKALRLSIPVSRLAAADSPSLSVAEGAEAAGTPLLVTTVDHALLQAEWVRRFLADAPAEADLCALLAPSSVVEAVAPGARRTWLRFRDGRYSACNLFLLKTPRALNAVRLWREVEAHRKAPLKIAAMLGPGMLLGYGLGLLTLDDAVRRLGRKASLTAAAVRTPFGLASVDVDKPADLDLVRRLLGET